MGRKRLNWLSSGASAREKKQLVFLSCSDRTDDAGTQRARDSESTRENLSFVRQSIAEEKRSRERQPLVDKQPWTYRRGSTTIHRPVHSYYLLFHGRALNRNSNWENADIAPISAVGECTRYKAAITPNVSTSATVLFHSSINFLLSMLRCCRCISYLTRWKARD